MRMRAKAAATALAAALAATATLAAACGGSGPTSGPTTSEAPTATQAAGGAASTAPSAAKPAAPVSTPTPSGQAQGPGRCHTSMLSAHVTLGSPGAGQRYAFLVLTNASGVTCQVFGYPGMQLANASSQPIVTAVVRVAATPQVVTLAPGQPAYTLLHWTVVPATNETGASCEAVPSVLLVTPPDETATLRASWPGGSVCQHGMIDVAPVKPGTGG
jgi:Protein of unknown function (DUF4232)